jgi:glycerophosphoryl diester phosphodiesterase
MPREKKIMTLARYNFEKPLIIGHRGFRSRYPENTLAAFAGAIDAGADMIEFDVQLTKDGHPVVIHDRTLDRTTNGAGPVTACSLSELKKLNAGSWFHSRFCAETIPTLDEVLDLADKKVLMNIEIKVDDDQPLYEYEGIEHKVINSVNRRNLMPHVLMSSFHKPILENLHGIDPRAAIGVLTEFGEKPDLSGMCRALDAFSWNPYYLELEEITIASVHKKGFKVIPYTVNDPDDIRRLIQLGVDGLFTDDPQTALEIRDP